MRRYLWSFVLLFVPFFQLSGQVQSPDGENRLQVGKFGIAKWGKAEADMAVFGFHGYQAQGPGAMLYFSPALPANSWKLTYRTENQLVILSWDAPASFPGDKIVVEFSTDGIEFQELAWEQALPGQVGTAKVVQPYDLPRYYRLKAPAYHRTIAYSNVVRVTTTKTASLDRMQMVLEPVGDIFRFVRADGVRGVSKDLRLETHDSQIREFEERQGGIGRKP